MIEIYDAAKAVQRAYHPERVELEDLARMVSLPVISGRAILTDDGFASWLRPPRPLTRAPLITDHQQHSLSNPLWGVDVAVVPGGSVRRLVRAMFRQIIEQGDGTPGEDVLFWRRNRDRYSRVKLR